VLDILFVQNYYEQMIGIMYISALVKKHGFTTDIVIGTKEKIIKQTLQKKPKVIGFYCTTGFHHKALAIAQEIKKILGDKILTVLGGPHPTFVPKVIRSNGIDIICRGEGEYAILELIQALNTKQDYTGIKNLNVKKSGHIYENEIRKLCDINSLPHPDRELYKNIDFIYKNIRQEVLVGRGCYFDCSYCSNHAFIKLYKGKGQYFRLRSVLNIIDELEEIQKHYHPACFFFHDDTFIYEKRFTFEFLEAYKKKIALPFACLIRADIVTQDQIKLLQQSGCYFTYFGVETGNEQLRNTLLNKNLSDETILNCAKLLHRYEIPFSTFNMVGLPGETLSNTWETIRLNTKINPKWAWFSVYQTLPETKLAKYTLEQGLIDSIDVEGSDATFHRNSIILRNDPCGIKINRLKNCANLLIKLPYLSGIIKKIFLNLPFDLFYSGMDKFLYYIFYYSRLTYKLGFIRTLRSAFFMIRHLKEFE
jgi:radical SAM superfamily enzyme YgiQ (UPF0313 family)